MNITVSAICRRDANDTLHSQLGNISFSPSVSDNLHAAVRACAGANDLPTTMLVAAIEGPQVRSGDDHVPGKETESGSRQGACNPDTATTRRPLHALPRSKR